MVLTHTLGAFTYLFIIYLFNIFLVAQTAKRLSTMWETWVWSLGWEDFLEKEMATHSSTLALKIPWTEELGAGYYPWGCKESGTNERLHFHFLSILMWNSNWTGCPAFYLPTPVSFHLYLEHPMILLSQSTFLFPFGEDSVKKKSPFSWSFSWHTLSHQPPYKHPLIKWRMGGHLDVLKYFPKYYLI